MGQEKEEPPRNSLESCLAPPASPEARPPSCTPADQSRQLSQSEGTGSTEQANTQHRSWGSPLCWVPCGSVIQTWSLSFKNISC